MHVLITTRSIQEEAIFPGPGDYFKYLQIMIEAKNRHARALYGFCLMPDYCKIIASFPNGAAVREFIREINHSYENHLFIVYAIQQTWFKNEPPQVLMTSCEIVDMIKFVEHEPVEAGIVRSDELYHYSSAYHRASQHETIVTTSVKSL